MEYFRAATTALGTALLAAVILIFIRSCGTSKSKRKLPPSPKGGLPVIGHLHLLGKLPHQSLLNLATQYGGLMYFKFGTVGSIVVSTGEYAKEVLKTNDLVFASRPVVQASTVFGYKEAHFLWAPYGKFWRNLRKLCTTKILTSRRVEMLRPLRELEVQVLLSLINEACETRAATNLSSMVMDCTFNTVARTVMSSSFSRAGSEAEKQAAKSFRDNLTAGVKTVSNLQIGDIFPSLGWLNFPLMLRMKKLMFQMDHYLQTVLQQHKNNWKSEHEPKDFMDVMLANWLNDDVIKAQAGVSQALSDLMATDAFLLFRCLPKDMTIAGMDTTAVAVEWTLSELIKHPEAMQLAQQELDQVVGKERYLEEDDIPKLKYLQAVIKESLRLHPPGAILLPHESMEDCMVGEYFVPAKTRVFINSYAIGRDPSVWENPHHFHPQRFLYGAGASIDVKGRNYELLPFGSGRRMCPGMTLGLLMVHVLVGTLIHGFNWRRADGLPAEELDMTEEFGIVVPRKVPLVLVPSSRLK